MKRLRPLVLAAGLTLALLPAAARAQLIETMAVSPDGETLLVGGDNRVVYTVETATMAVTGRRYIPETVEDIAFSADGTLVYFRDGEKTLTAYDPAGLEPKWSQREVSEMVYLPGPNLLVALESRWDGSALTLVDAATGVASKRIDLGEFDGEYVAVSADASTAIVLSGSERSDDEPRENTPGDLDGYAEYVFKQQHDGSVSHVATVDLAAATFDVAQTFFRTSFPNGVRMLGDKAVFLNGNGDSAMIAAGGGTELLDMGDEYFSMAVTTLAGDELVFTDGQEVSFRPLDPAQPSTAPVLDAGRVPGGAERATAMAEAADGTIYFGTSAYRVLKVAADRGTISAHPVF